MPDRGNVSKPTNVCEENNTCYIGEAHHDAVGLKSQQVVHDADAHGL
jgi:hypothetical protein